MADTLGRKSYARIADVLTLPSLIEVQNDSFNWFLNEGLGELFEEVSPIESFNGGMQLWFPSRRVDPAFNLKYWFDKPKYSIDECVERDMTFAAPLYVQVLLMGSEVPNPIKNDIFLGDFPQMTNNGTFIVNGTERVVVSQLIRSPGVYFEAEEDRTSGRSLAAAKLIPDRGAWMEFETRKSDYITIKFNRKRTVPVSILLRALAAVSDGLPESAIKEGTDEEILALFKDVDNNPDHLYMPATLRQEPTWEPRDKRSVAQEALIE
jgi:DNA-directed RNA polymerase subunit beta